VKIGSLFSGYGGLDMAAEAVFGGTTVWHSEVDPHASKVLALRWPGVPNLGDITAIDWSTVEPVDVIAGGSPCQDLSSAGRRSGMGPGTRSGLWSAMCRAIEVVQPRFVIWENVHGALSACAANDLQPCPRCVGGSGRHQPVLRALGRVLGDLATLGFDAEWTSVRASDVGAPHRRERIFLLAWPAEDPRRGQRDEADTGEADGPFALRPAGVAPRSGRGPAADTPHLGHERPRLTWGGRPRPAHGGDAATDASGARTGRDGRAVPRSTQPSGWSDLDVRAALDARPDAWGPYAAAVARWEHVTGHPAPSPTDERGRLNAPFAEWMMGLPPGWVTGPDVTELGVPRSAQLRMIGNGVVPRQAEAAARILLERAWSPLAVAS